MVGIEIIFLVPFTLKFSYFNKEERLIYAYLVTCVIYGIGSDLLARIFGNNMAFISCIYLVQFIILSLFYINVLKSPFAKKALKWIMLAAAILFTVDITLLEGPLKFNSVFIAFRSALLIVYGVMFFLQLMRDEGLIEKSIYINSLPVFWFNAGLFVNVCCGFLLNLSFNLIQQKGPGEVLVSMYKITAALYWIAGIIQVILFYIGLVKIKRARA
jgi:hypothetical protein